MTKSVTKVQDKDTKNRLSVVRSTEDPTKYGVVILNPDGSKIRGPKGDAATVDVGTTTTGLPGTSASVVNSGTTSDAVLDFTIPRGDKGDKGDTGTIAVGSTTTGEPGTSASVVNSGTSTAAVFDFTIPKGDKGDKGNTGTISVGSTTTGNPGTNASVTNSGTSTAAVFNFTIPRGDVGETGNGIASVTTSKSGKITTVTITDTDGNVDSFTVSDGEDGEGAGDVLGPNSSTDGDIVLFDGATGKLIKDSGKAVSDFVQTSGTQTIAGTKTFSTSPVVPSKSSDAGNNPTVIATEAQVKKVADAIPSVIDSLTSTSTTDALSAAQGKLLKDTIDTYAGLGRFLSLWNCATGQPMSFPLDTPYTYNTGDWFMIEVTGTTNYMPNGSSYTGTASTTVDTTNPVKKKDVYIYDGTDWLFQENNVVDTSFSSITGSPMDNTNLATALNAKANDNGVVHLAGAETITGVKTFGTTNTWSFDGTNATLYSPSANGYLYVTRGGTVPVTMAIKSGTSGGTFGTTTAHQFQFRTNDTARMTVQSAAQGGKVELAAGSIPSAGDNSGLVPSTSWVNTAISNAAPGSATSSVAGIVKLGSDTVQSVNAETVSGNANRTYAIQKDSNGKMVVNVPRTDNNTTYSAGTGLSLTGTTFSNSGVTSVNGSNGAVTVSEFTATTGGVKVFDLPSVGDDISDVISWISGGGNAVFVSGAINGTRYYYNVYRHSTNSAGDTLYSYYENVQKVISADQSHQVVSLTNETFAWFEPSNAGSTDQVLTKTAAGYQWATPSGGDVMVSSQANNILTSGMKIWAGTQSNYDNLGTYDTNTVYLTIEE